MQGEMPSVPNMRQKHAFYKQLRIPSITIHSEYAHKGGRAEQLFTHKKV